MSTFGYNIEVHVAKAMHAATDDVTQWDHLTPPHQEIWRGHAKAALGAMKKYQFKLDRDHQVDVPRAEMPALLKYLDRPNGYYSPARDIGIHAVEGGGIRITTFPWTAHEMHNAQYRHPAPPSPEGPALEWAVEYVTAGTTPHVGYNQFADQASCERFIQSPPLWFDTAWQSVTGVVTRQAAGPWERIPENKNLEPVLDSPIMSITVTPKRP